MAFNKSDYQFVRYTWKDSEAEDLSELDKLVYRSNKLGEDPRITNTGGGNTSAKLEEMDPLTKKPVEVLWVKGSGGDLRTAKRENFSSLYQEKLESLDEVYEAAPEKGYKSTGEDSMVDMFKHCTFCLNPRASSIDTPLHSMIAQKHVDHLHPNAVIAVASCEDQEALTSEIWQGALAYVPWMRPGWEAARKCEEEFEKNPEIKGILLGQHGHTNWAGENKTCYETSLWVIETAARYIDKHDKGEQSFGGQKFKTPSSEVQRKLLCEILPFSRGLLSGNEKFIATIQYDTATLEFVNSHDAPRLAELGTSCPDHFLRTKIKPLYIDWDPEHQDVEQLKTLLTQGVERYRQDYADYYNKHSHPDSPAMRDPNPRVILIPGLGMIGWGKDKSESRVTAEFYNCAIAVMRGAEAISKYTALPPQEAFDIEYWALEEAKLARMPKEKEKARDVVVVIGAGDGIGKAVAKRLTDEGAHVVCADMRFEAAQAVADELAEKHGKGIGVAGSDESDCGRVSAFQVDITDRASTAQMFEKVVLAYGGIDDVILTAGIFLAPGEDEKENDLQFDKSFAVNVKGAYIVADEARKIWSDQGMEGAMVMTTSVNGVVAKRGSLAYDSSKAAANHLVRELAIELAPKVRVNGLAPATVVEGSTMFYRSRVISSLKKYNIDFQEGETDQELRRKLAQFYAQRTLTKNPITPDDQAEVAFLLCSKSMSKTTGQIISVDGGLHEAFLR